MNELLKAMKALFLKQQGSTDDSWAAMESDIKAILSEKIVSDEGAISIPKGVDPDTRAIMQGLIDQNKILMQNVKDLQGTISKEQQDRENAIKLQQERAKAEQQTKVQDAVNKLFKDGKITEAQKGTWLTAYEKDYDTAEKIAADLKSSSGGASPDHKTSVKPSGFNSISGSPLLGAIRKMNDQQYKGDTE